MKEVLDIVWKRFVLDMPHSVSVKYLIPSQLRNHMETGEAFDVLIVSAEFIDLLARDGVVLPQSETAVGRIGIGVAIKAGNPRPDISTVEAFKQVMLNARSISYTSGTIAGSHIAAVMERLGIAEEMKPKTKLSSGGGQNPRAVAAGEVEYGISVMSDIQPVDGVELLGPLPSELQKYITWKGGVTVKAQDQKAGLEFLRFLTSDDFAAIFREKWIEPLLGRD
jgi:molybdate transport system substrate-binding protein